MRKLWRQISKWQWLLIIAIQGNLIVYMYLSWQQRSLDNRNDEYRQHNPEQRHLITFPEHSATVIFREFETFDNDIVATVASIKTVAPALNIVVVVDHFPYPPLNISSAATLLILNTPVDGSPSQHIPETVIRTEYVMLLLDSCELTTSASVDLLINFLKEQPEDVKMVAWNAFAMRDVRCLGLNVKLKQWTLQYYNSQEYCGAVEGHFGLLMKRNDLLSLPYPFLRPMASSLFVQTTIRGWKIAMYKDLTFRRRKKLLQDGHLNWKFMNLEQDRIQSMYNEFGLKVVYHADGGEEWYGCRKKSNRCFGTIVNDMPEYLYHGKWTPPCCLKALRITARYVFSKFESEGVRYWLEGGSLLGAARYGDIIPWDYDVDVGIYFEDIAKSKELIKCDFSSYIDDQGYLWEKAIEGEFYRVHYSQTNRLHVDIYPFYPRNGTMTKDTWMKSHRQDTEFPEHFLKPLVPLEFVGMKASAPNNWKDFLELKFGKGVIENPHYPDLTKVT